MRSTATWRRAYGRCGTGTRISSRAMSAEPGDAVAGRFDLELSQSQREQLAVLARLLRDRDAPTSARAAEGAASVHVADSLVALALDVVRGAGTIADVGAGAGFPGLALAVALPRSEGRLVGGPRRAGGVLRRAGGGAGGEDARGVWVRAAGWGAGGPRA